MLHANSAYNYYTYTVTGQVHVPMCDKADPSKCSKEFYFDQNQVAQVPGDNSLSSLSLSLSLSLSPCLSLSLCLYASRLSLSLCLSLSVSLCLCENQVAQVPGDNWSNDTEDVYQGLICKGKSCNCGALPCGEHVLR